MDQEDIAKNGNAIIFRKGSFLFRFSHGKNVYLLQGKKDNYKQITNVKR